MINLKIIYIFILTISVGCISGYIGSLMVTKRMALMGGALGHLTMPGIAFAMIYNFDISLGATVFLLIGITVIWFLEQQTKLPPEALTAVVFACSLASAVLFLPESKAIRALIGDLSNVSWKITLITAILSLVIFIIIRKLYSGLILSTISSDIAYSMGINVKKYNFIFLTCIAIIIALGVRMVGGLMTAALVAIPACTSKNISKNLIQYSYISMLLGGISCLVGTYIFLKTNIPAGPLIILFSGIFFLISLFFKKL